MTLDQTDAAYLKTLTVLYVEDDPAAREEIGIFLRRRVGSLVVATDGVEGLAAYKARSPQIVVTDIQMPHMDGLAMAREIRDLSPSVPILVTTAFEQTDFLMRAISIGVDQYVLKPIQGYALEEALLKAAHRLLGDEQLRQRQRLEAEAARMRHHAALSVLMEGIAHDYNNLLQAILTAVGLAKVKLDPGTESHRLLEHGESFTEQANLLGRRLMMLANPSHQADRTGPVEGLVRKAVQEALAGSSITPVFQFDTLGASVRYSEANLSRAIGNLAQNAREALPTGGTFQVASEVRTLEPRGGGALPGGSYLHLQFHDSGMGIPSDSLPMIFEPYFTTKERGNQKGTGLGLALCDAIVRAHGGTISAESIPGEGATFHLYLPVAGA